MKKIIYNLLLLTFFASCETEIDLKIPGDESPALVVEGYVTEGNPIASVKLTTTIPFNTSGVNPAATNVESVKIKRTDSLGNVSTTILTQSTADPAYYFTNKEFVPSYKDKYELEVKFKGETFVASSEIFQKVKVDSFSYEYQTEKFGQVKGYYVDFSARPQNASVQYFLFEKVKNGKLYYESLNDLINIWDNRLTKQLTFPAPILFGINPQPNQAKAGFDKNKDYPYALGDTLVINTYSIDENVFRYYSDLLQQASSQQGGLGPLFAPPMDNVRGNIKNLNPNGIKVTGIFSARGLNATTIIIK
ncbi:MAG: hypothetical protein RLZZ175_2988 [Bacteroidota bacterium]|jgi:hypothetical protein